MHRYQVDVLIQGFPGRAICHGGLGWSTVTLIRGEGRIILLDVGAFGMRKPLERRLQEFAVKPEDVTDVVLTHAHYDHVINFTLFPNAKVWIGQVELDWAALQPPGFNPLPELYVQELVRSDRVLKLTAGEEFIPGIHAYAVPGDSAKNRAELLSRKVVDTDDEKESAQSIELIWRYWKQRPGNLLIPGHDLSMVLDAQDQPSYFGDRKAAIRIWFSESIEHSDVIDLTGA